jgi:hypothetical protein
MMIMHAFMGHPDDVWYIQPAYYDPLASLLHLKQTTQKKKTSRARFPHKREKSRASFFQRTATMFDKISMLPCYHLPHTCMHTHITSPVPTALLSCFHCVCVCVYVCVCVCTCTIMHVYQGLTDAH